MATEPETTPAAEAAYDECPETWCAADEEAMTIIFEKFIIQNRKFPHNLVGRFALLWGMMEEEIKPNGILAEYWDEFSGDEDFREVNNVRPWQDQTQNAVVNCFNYGFNEEVWKCYRKKHNILKKYLKEICADEDAKRERSKSRGRRRSRSRDTHKRPKSKDRSSSRKKHKRERSKSSRRRSKSRREHRRTKDTDRRRERSRSKDRRERRKDRDRSRGRSRERSKDRRK